MLIGINLWSLPTPSVTFGFSSETPNIEGVLGPYISASNKPVFNPNLAKEHAIFTAIVLLPTPPLPLLTAIICLIPSTFFKSGTLLSLEDSD